MAINVNYQKRKNVELFACFKQPDTLFLDEVQNYMPMYNSFFALNETNFNSVNFNHKWYLSGVQKPDSDDPHLFECKVKNIANHKTKNKDVFFKMAPLLDPFKYLIGKYDAQSPNLFKLPTFVSDATNTNPKYLDRNNSAYVDGLFLFLSSNLIYEHGFAHGVDYYGSFLAVKNDFRINIIDDLDYLKNSDFFNKNKNVLFKVENYDHLFQDEHAKLTPLKIEHNLSSISTQSFDEACFENIFDGATCEENRIVDLKELPSDFLFRRNLDNNTTTLRSNSSCSSRSSHTTDDENCISDGDEESSAGDDSENNSDDSSLTEEVVEATIPKFPVDVICMEYCENTLDDLIMSNDLSDDEWYSALMQIIMILITYQKSFAFTHNDLHTNNVMYNSTDKKYIYYCYKSKYYKVPTFGRIFKIIDFGRSIYKFNGTVFCSDSFQTGNDAATQYNTEPYFDESKPRLDPNYSFDLCRLACSIFDYLIKDMSEIKNLKKCDPIKRLIVEWCLDDNGVNVLYKNNGDDRYPDFKLYKMITRCVHNHTPSAQLDRPEFKSFLYMKKDIPSEVIDIDKINVYT
jgi:hypothetical protein